LKNLSEIKEGEKVKVNCLNCGHNLKHRLCSLGIYTGKDIEIIKNDKKGPIIVKVFDSKLAIGRGQAEKIEIEC